ncbi:hypothetical protein A2634_04560 [Candidatus Amesbacteria bacterium RIFCSPHIGHO2_01_FULL_48_32]|uniref:Peptidase S54 rhomboid domain-containing protein n=1 Tax=Candidatus Amesbacteria bacterium RIFCSPLOWO2_01_FULL_48_25 TaxID=1797259 RepID=A0A1F4ZBZ3_9BACT|nr:MAG: hypothetical protein A2634_04560 [Candidatus Amesbacteria bacterium RIFCSPHIGHO2_01_FULL_48_32]OGD03812.1 MAG: hypothetical protein A2989_04030 [Candidatus Amesbacteria bacterium RIFCSPLOWO2_01_FULL_48_25]HJZ05079.1 rhomboid family intramembrane serine protease [Patescibacteria group bacterium]
MIPLRDHNKSLTWPVVTYLLIGINLWVFFQMWGMSPSGLEEFVETWSVRPASIMSGMGLVTLLTSMFLHGGIAHVLGNMLFLHIFGDNLEDRLGHIGYLIYYLVSGVAGSVAQIWADPSSTIPMLGASGAIAGLMGGYLVLFPRHRIDVLIPWGFWFEELTLPAWTMLIYWIIFQVFGSLGSLGVDGGGIAYMAHVGGFAAGVVLVKFFLR